MKVRSTHPEHRDFTIRSVRTIAASERTGGADTLLGMALTFVAGAVNAGLLAVSILSNSRPELRERLRLFRQEQTDKVREERLP